MDAGQVGLHLLAGFLSCIPVGLLRIQLVAASLERLPAHVTLIFLIISPWVCEITKKALRQSCSWYISRSWSCSDVCWPVVKGSRVALGLFLQTYGRATEQSRFCQRPDDSVLITAQLCSSAWFGCSEGGHEEKNVTYAKVPKYANINKLRLHWNEATSIFALIATC